MGHDLEYEHILTHIHGKEWIIGYFSQAWDCTGIFMEYDPPMKLPGESEDRASEFSGFMWRVEAVLPPDDVGSIDFYRASRNAR